jgi:hypothetical protein
MIFQVAAFRSIETGPLSLDECKLNVVSTLNLNLPRSDQKTREYENLCSSALGYNHRTSSSGCHIAGEDYEVADTYLVPEAMSQQEHTLLKIKPSLWF